MPNNRSRWAETETETEPKETLPQVHFVSSTIISCPPIQPLHHVTPLSHLVVPIILNPNISIQYFRFKITSSQYFRVHKYFNPILSSSEIPQSNTSNSICCNLAVTPTHIRDHWSGGCPKEAEDLI